MTARVSGGGAVRVGDTVRRPAGPGTPLAQAVLRHLWNAGLRSVPEPLGVDEQGREVFRWIEGDAGAFPVRAETAADAALVRFARLVREIHDATAGFPLELGSFDDLLADPSGSGEVICHNDLSIPNTIFRNGEPIAIVDWEFAAPGFRLWDLAYACWWWVPLHRPACARSLGWPADVDPLRRLRLFCDAYGVSAGNHQRFFDVIHDRQIANQRQLRLWVDQGVIPPYDENDESIEVGRTDYIDARRHEFLAALRR